MTSTIERFNPARTDELVGVGRGGRARGGRRRGRPGRRGPARLGRDLRGRARRWRCAPRSRGSSRTSTRSPSSSLARPARCSPTVGARLAFATSLLGFYADRGEALLVDDETGTTTTARPAPAATPAVRRGRGGHAVERAGGPDRPQARAGAGRRQRGRRQAVAAGAVRGRRGSWRSWPTVCPTGWSRSSTATRRPRPRWSRTPVSHRVAFTGGSTPAPRSPPRAGRALRRRCSSSAATTPRSCLPDADLAEADWDRLVWPRSPPAARSAWRSSGSMSRRSRADEMVASYVAAAERVLRLGDPLDPGVDDGPGRHCRVPGQGRRRWSTTPASRGAAVGRARHRRPGHDLDRGHYLRPILVLGAADDDPLVCGRAVRPGPAAADLRLGRGGGRPRQRRRPRARRLGVVRRRGPRLRRRRAGSTPASPSSTPTTGPAWRRTSRSAA